ncbi:uncharacterized protein [Aristolochia californica]|uniref:uncharacterized protein isoform X1 n=1 Tax=Aristolochia californica TaxID=171875 RepID=UPI0035E24022
MAISVPSKLNLSSFPSAFSAKKRALLVARCTPLQQSIEEGLGILCEPCNGKGWLLCSFCQGQKTNVKADNNRIYRRCPSCKASFRLSSNISLQIGYVLCANCKVFKCVTFPDFDDGEL